MTGPPAIAWRDATRQDVPAVVDMLRDDALGATRETGDTSDYLAAFDAMRAEGANHLVVGEAGGRIVATFQITFITGLSHRASRRAQVESVRVAADLRGRGIGRALMAEAELRAAAAGCRLIQLTTHADRDRAHRFYAALGYEATHLGFKKPL